MGRAIKSQTSSEISLTVTKDKVRCIVGEFGTSSFFFRKIPRPDNKEFGARRRPMGSKNDNGKDARPIKGGLPREEVHKYEPVVAEMPERWFNSKEDRENIRD